MNLSAKGDSKSYYFQRAEEAYQQKDYDECIRISEMGVKENPKDGYCWGLLAELYSKRANGQYAKALEAADQALKYIPKKDTQWQAFLVCIKGDVYYKVEDYSAAKVAYRQAMMMDPDHTEYPVDYADVCFQLREYEEGVRVYKELLEAKGTPVYAYAELGRGYYHLGRTEDAKKACNMAIVLSNDENAAAHHTLAWIAADEGHLPQACREEARALAIADHSNSEIADSLLYLCRPLLDAAVRNELQKVYTDASAHLHVANYFHSSANYVELFRHILLAEQYGSEHKDLLQAYAISYDCLGEQEKSIELTLQQMANDTLSEDHKAYYYHVLSGYHRALGQTEKSTEYALLEHAADPEDGDIYRLIGRNYIMEGNLQQALVYMDSAVMVATEERMPTSLFNRAEVHRRMGNEESARRDLDEALSYRNAQNHDRTTFLFVEAMQGQREALDHYTDSILSLHAFTSVYGAMYDMISCYAQLQDKDKVMQLLDKYFSMGYRQVANVRHYYRLDWLREEPDFQALLTRWEAVRQEDLRRVEEMLKGGQEESDLTELPFTMESGVMQVKCVINGLPLYFVFDTGASDVTISSVEANFMLKNEYLSDADFLGKQNYVTATGEIHEGTVINLREVRVGDVVLKDVKASVVKSQHAPLLLGQSVFRRFGTLEVDNKASIIRFRK